ncbi:MAG: GHKL domain-containing protein [Lachnospiraceae bacterium]|nr:GHKL domain-containing protein [Lachnospiraceae bacterium]
MGILGYCWEVFVNFIEACLYFYLLFSNLIPKDRPKYFFIGYGVLRIICISIINFCPILASHSYLIMLVFDLILAFICFEGSKLFRLLMGCSYILIAAFAEHIAYTFTIYFTSYDLTQLTLAGDVRVQITLLYLLISCIVIYILSRRKQDNKLFLSLPIQFIVFIFIALAIFVSDKLLGITIDITKGNISEKDIPILNIACFFILFLIFSFIIFTEQMGRLSYKNIMLMQEKERTRAEHEQLQLTQDYIHTLRVWKHDYKNHLVVIQSLLQAKNYETLSSYLTQLSNEDVEDLTNVSTGNSIVDSVVSSKLIIAKQRNIKFTYHIYLPDKSFSISDVEFASMLSNVLDNSIDACTKIGQEHAPFISLDIKPYRNMLCLRIKNSSCGNYKFNRFGELLSIKSEPNHGMGLKRIESIVRKADGFTQIEPQDNLFSITILIPFL